jgi:hypothetical protein
VRVEPTHLLGGKVVVGDHSEPAVVGIQDVHRLSGDVDLGVVDVVLAHLAAVELIEGDLRVRPEILCRFVTRLWRGDNCLLDKLAFLVDAFLRDPLGQAVEVRIREVGRGTGVVNDLEGELVLIGKSRVPRPMICLNSAMEPTGRNSTMLRQVGMSTPVESSFEVVAMTGVSRSGSMKSLRCSWPTSPSSATILTT